MGKVQLPTEDEPAVIVCGDCRDVLPSVPSASVDAVITDPPYPGIVRDYGTWTEAEWFDLMNPVVEECRRILKPSGSAVFILQPNSERLGRMRTWLWKFMHEWGERWGIVQDVWWWHYTAIPEAHAIQGKLLRPSVKACVWLGPPDCWRDQTAVRWDVSDYTVSQAMRSVKRFREGQSSGHGVNRIAMCETAIKNGGSTPYNLLPVSNARGHTTAGAFGHGAGTPADLLRWWIRYVCPINGTAVDPFHGTGTTALTCLEERRWCLGIERDPSYVSIANSRLAEPLGVGGLFDPKLAPERTLFEAKNNVG